MRRPRCDSPKRHRWARWVWSLAISSWRRLVFRRSKRSVSFFWQFRSRCRRHHHLLGQRPRLPTTRPAHVRVSKKHARGPVWRGAGIRRTQTGRDGKEAACTSRHDIRPWDGAGNEGASDGRETAGSFPGKDDVIVIVRARLQATSRSSVRKACKAVRSTACICSA